MSVTNPFSISYAGRSLGGTSSSYQLLGPYVIDKSYRTLRLVCDVLVVASSYDSLQSLSDALEEDFRKRDEDLVISLGGNTWTYTNGTDYFNPVCSIVKSGDSETDRGFSRAYTVSIEAELPSDDDGTGLLESKFSVSYEPSRRVLVTCEGAYTATSGSTSVQNYQSNASSLCTSFISSLTGSPTMELLEEDYDVDRNEANTNWRREYQHILYNQSSSSLDDAEIKDHRVVFTDLSQHPADSREGVQRLRRVVGSFECFLDIEQTTDPKDLFESKIRSFLTNEFKSEFSPTEFCLEDRRISYDQTSKRLSASLQWLYQKEGGEAVVEVAQSVAYREMRTIDYTPVHAGGELTMYADVGWATVERVWTRTAVILGDELPQRRLGQTAKYNEIGEFDAVGSVKPSFGKDVSRDGWNIISNTSQVSDQWIGDPSNDGNQLKLTAITETVVERLHIKPGGGTRVPRRSA